MNTRPDVDEREGTVGLGSSVGADGVPQRDVEETPPSSRPGDRAVQSAFALGWHVAELYHAEVLSDPSRQCEEPPPARLPGFSLLPSHQRVEMYLAQVDELAPRVCSLRDYFGGDIPTRHIRAQRELEEPSAERIRRAIADLHEVLLRGLTATDFRVGKAYGLGRALCETVLLPSARQPESFAELFRPSRVAVLQSWLLALKSAFPRYAAYAVKETLDDWLAWVKEPSIYHGPGALSSSQQLTRGGRSARGARSRVVAATRRGRRLDWSDFGDAHQRRVDDCLHQQGRLWYALLSGETVATDLLVIEDYVDNIGRLQSHARKLMWQVVDRWWRAVLIAVALALAGLGVVAIAVGAHELAAASGALFVALGVSWKGVASGLTSLFRTVQPPLWEAELAESVAYATRSLPNDPPLGVAAGEAAGVEGRRSRGTALTGRPARRRASHRHTAGGGRRSPSIGTASTAIVPEQTESPPQLPPSSWTTSVPQDHEHRSRVTDRDREPAPSLRG
jgi:hypothetical protein